MSVRWPPSWPSVPRSDPSSPVTAPAVTGFFLPSSAKEIEDRDSLEHIDLIAAEDLKMRFTMKEVSGMKNVGEMAAIVAERAKK